jgi:hypothetical protein
MIYAIFLCFQALGTCQMYGAARMQLGEYTPAITFASPEDCQAYISKLTPYKPNAQGRSTAGQGTWYECRGKRVDTWEPIRPKKSDDPDAARGHPCPPSPVIPTGPCNYP